MPTSTLLQLVARGRQDAYLTSNPQFTFFKQVYRRHTPFAIESIPIELDGTLNLGQRISCLIPRKAELLSSIFLEIDLPPIPKVGDTDYFWVNDVGHALIYDVSIEIGEKEIDKQTGEWMQIWGELTTPPGLRYGYNEMIGHFNAYPPSVPEAGLGLKLQIPLRFWFCHNIGLAIPLIALQAHPIRLIFHLRPFNNLWWSANGLPSTPPNPVQPTRLQLYADYIFLDKDERQMFAAREHEYLIEQLQIVPPQTVTAGANSAIVPLILNHCCKEFVWVIQQTRMQGLHEWFNYSNSWEYNGGGPEPGVVTDDLLGSALLRLDGYDRFYARSARYFRITQPYQRHTNVPDRFIYLYSFSLRPEADQPSGTINASKIDDIRMQLQFNTAQLGYERQVSFFATNYNVLRIMGGLGGVAFIS